MALGLRIAMVLSRLKSLNTAAEVNASPVAWPVPNTEFGAFALVLVRGHR